MLVQETDRGGYCVESALSDYVRKGQVRSSRRVHLVHRLDRDTSGVMMVAKNADVQDYFRSNWNDITEKTYLALVVGHLTDDSGVFESFLAEDPQTLRVHSVKDSTRGKLARTEWTTLDTTDHPATTLVKVNLKTGRKNQIRVHFAESGHPVVGDEKYGGATAGRGRLCLHAWKLAFIHPHSGKRLEFESEPPAFASTAVAKKSTAGSDSCASDRFRGQHCHKARQQKKSHPPRK